ncbi:MAG: hypothetical protein ACLFNX_04785 [Spirochaetaceae bacterium]
MGTRATHGSRGRVATIVLTTVLLLALGGCEFFTASAFPEYVSSIQAERSLSSWTAGDDSSVYLDATVNPLQSWVLVGIETTDGTRRMIILDNDLNILANYTEEELSASAAGPGALGRTTGVDLAGRSVVGQFVFDDSLDPIVGTSAPADATLVTRFDEEEPGNNRMLLFDIDNGSSELTVESYSLESSYPYEWEDDGVTAQGPLGPAGPYAIEQGFAFDEDGAGDGTVALLIRDEGSAELYVTIFAFAEVPPVATLPDPTSSYLEDDRTPYSLGEVAADGAWLTSAGIVVRTKDSNEYRVHETETGKKTGDFNGLDDVRHEAAYPLDANFYFVFDYERETLYKLANWW